MTHLLDDPVSAALHGPDAPLAQVQGSVRRYPPEMSPFMALPRVIDAAAWRDAHLLLGEDGVGAIVRDDLGSLPDGWTTRWQAALVQLVGPGAAGDVGGGANTGDVGGGANASASELPVVPLTDDDVPAMLALTQATQPGPFHARTIDFGNYLGIYDGGALVAMAGHRMRATGWTEISAVATAATHRGRGLAARLVQTLVAGIAARGERPFMHATTTNLGAIRLYESLGFVVRHHLTVTAVAPER